MSPKPLASRPDGRFHPVTSAARVKPYDRERALLLIADDFRTVQPEACDLLALIDFLEG